MKEHDGCRRAFHHTGAAFYAKAVLPSDEIIDCIRIGFYAYEGGTTGEFEINWQMLGGELTPQLTAFNDSWHALNECRDLLEAMADKDNERISPLEMCELLKSLGFEDITKREAPNAGLTGMERSGMSDVETIVSCDCHRCIKENELTCGHAFKLPLDMCKMIVCPECGNKRCPKASDHRLDCTNSNEPGQAGSIYN